MAKNVDTVHAIYRAFAQGDIPFVLGLFHPHIEWSEAENFIYSDGNPYVGPQAILDGVFARLGSEWNAFSATPEQILDAGETVVSLGRYRGSYKNTGIAVNAQFVHVFTFQDGKLVKFQQYTDTAQFREAAGRSASAKAQRAGE